MWFSIYGPGYIYEMYCTGPFLKFLICATPTFTKNASSEPGLGNRKRPTCLGQLEAQLKKWVGAFPITTYISECETFCDTASLNVPNLSVPNPSDSLVIAIYIAPNGKCSGGFVVSNFKLCERKFCIKITNMCHSMLQHLKG